MGHVRYAFCTISGIHDLEINDFNSVTPLKANFMHHQGLVGSEINL